MNPLILPSHQDLISLRLKRWIQIRIFVLDRSFLDHFRNITKMIKTKKVLSSRTAPYETENHEKTLNYYIFADLTVSVIRTAISLYSPRRNISVTLSARGNIKSATFCIFLGDFLPQSKRNTKNP